MTTKNEHHEPDTPRDRVVPKLLLSYNEACWSMSVCERTLRNMVTRGELAIVKLGGRTLFDPADLEALKRANRTVRGKEGVDGGQELVK